MDGMELELGWARASIHKIGLEQEKCRGVLRQGFTVMGLDTNGRSPAFTFLVRTENLKNVQREYETNPRLELRRLQRQQQQGCSPQIVLCLNATHSHITSPKTQRSPVKEIFMFFQNTLSAYWCVCA